MIKYWWFSGVVVGMHVWVYKAFWWGCERLISNVFTLKPTIQQRNVVFNWKKRCRGLEAIYLAPSNKIEVIFDVVVDYLMHRQYSSKNVQARPPFPHEVLRPHSASCAFRAPHVRTHGPAVRWRSHRRWLMRSEFTEIKVQKDERKIWFELAEITINTNVQTNNPIAQPPLQTGKIWKTEIKFHL